MLHSIGVTVFWSQIAISILLLIGLVVCLGFLLWYRAQLRRALLDVSSPAPVAAPEPEPEAAPRSVPSQPADLNAAWTTDEAPGSKNPFEGWNVSTSFEHLKRPGPTNADKTGQAQAMALDDRRPPPPRARWTESSEQLALVQDQLLSATLSRLEQAGYNITSPSPFRTGSGRGTSSRRSNRRRANDQRRPEPNQQTDETNF